MLETGWKDWLHYVQVSKPLDAVFDCSNVSAKRGVVPRILKRHWGNFSTKWRNNKNMIMIESGKWKKKKHDNLRLTLKNESCKILKKKKFLQFFQPAFSLLICALWENHLAVAFIRYMVGKKRGRAAGYEYTGKCDALACKPAPQYLRI